MGNRGKRLLMWLTAALGLLLLGQLLGSLLPREPKTWTVRRREAAEPLYVTGIVIRQEIPIYAETPGNYVPQVADGEQVAAGETVFRWETSREVSALQRQLRVLDTREKAAAALPERRALLLHGALADLHRREPDGKDDPAETLLALVSGPEKSGEKLEKIRAILGDQTRAEAPVVTAPAAGIFVSQSDGLEQVLTPETLWNPACAPAGPANPKILGRLVTGDIWYFRGDLPQHLAVGDTLEAVLPGDDLPVTMTVEGRKNGQTLLSCSRDLALAAQTRKITLKILSKCKFGLEIPRDSLYTVGEEIGVWCLVGEIAQFKAVTVQEDLGGTLLVALDQTTTDTLWPGDRILLDPADVPEAS